MHNKFDKATKFKVYDSPTSDLRSTFPLRPHQPSCFKRQGTGKYLKSQQPEPPSFCNQQPPCLNERFSRSTTPQTSTPLRSYALAPQSRSQSPDCSSDGAFSHEVHSLWRVYLQRKEVQCQEGDHGGEILLDSHLPILHSMHTMFWRVRTDLLFHTPSGSLSTLFSLKKHAANFIVESLSRRTPKTWTTSARGARRGIRSLGE